MREKYKLPQDKFIVMFAGHFIERKGPLRVLEAINNIDGNIDDIITGVVKTILEPQPDNKPYSLYNTGNSKPVRLLDFIEAVEKATGKTPKNSCSPCSPAM